MSRAVLAKPLERDVQRACLEWLNLQWGVKVWRRNVGGMQGVYNGKKRFMRFGEAGMSDLEGIASGRHVEIEIKRPGQKPNINQAAWLEEMRKLGAIAFWTDSLESCIEQFTEATQCSKHGQSITGT